MATQFDQKAIVEEMLTMCKPQGGWYLITREPGFDQMGAIVLATELKNPFGRVVAIGQHVDKKVADIEIGDLIIYVEGINVSELKGMTEQRFYFVHENKVLGKIPETETYRKAMPKKANLEHNPFADK